MKILMVLEAVFPQDERVEKEIASLMAAGHEVRIATYSFEKCGFMETYMGYCIYRKKIGRIMYKFGAAILVLPFYFDFWRSYLRRIHREWPFEALHIHDLPLARLGSEWKSKRETVFVADQHEYYSNWIVKTAHYNRPLGKVISRLSRWESYEARNLRNADLVCTVEEPLREMYIRERGLDPGKVITVPNTPLSEIYSAGEARPDPAYFTLFYHGGLDRLRGLDVALEAVGLLSEDVPEIRMILVGRLNKHYDLQGRIRDLGLESRVRVKGWVDYRKLPEEIDQADLCFFIPPADRDEIHYTIATKIYQYMARGKPVIVGSARYMKAFVESNEIGLAIDENDPRSFADAVRELHVNRSLMKSLEENARKHRSSYFWEQTVTSLTGFYAGIRP